MQNPEVLMREFTRDEQATTISPSSMFKSSFAREVVQNVRRSMSSVNQDSLGSGSIGNIGGINNRVRGVDVNDARNNNPTSLKASSSSSSTSSSSSSPADDKGGGARTKSVRKLINVPDWIAFPDWI